MEPVAKPCGMRLAAAAVCALAFAIGCVSAARGTEPLPRPAHVIVLIEENRTLAQLLGNARAPYINSLFREGALFTDSYGVTHPSLPNYFALFAGATNTNGDGCPARGISKVAPNLGSELLAAHLSFAGYSEGLPSAGFTGCWAGAYGRKHAPWVHFANLPRSTNLPFRALPPYDALPTVSFIIPNVEDDMHDGTMARGDAWLKRHVGSLVAWAKTHDTLVILTWDEGYDSANHIPTVFVGPMVKPGRYSERIDHFRVLRTLEDMYSLPPSGRTRAVSAITGCWR